MYSCHKYLRLGSQKISMQASCFCLLNHHLMCFVVPPETGGMSAPSQGSAFESQQQQQQAVTETTLPASSYHTPDGKGGEDKADEGMQEVMSTPQQPVAGLMFDSLEAAQKHYLAYARRKGFGVRFNFRKKSEKTGELIRAKLVCQKAGHNLKKSEDPENPDPVVPERWRNTIERTDFPACMFVKRRGDSWVVTEINDEHT